MNRRDSVTAGLFILAVAAMIITLASFADGFIAAAGYTFGGALSFVGVIAVFTKPNKTLNK